MKLLSYSLLAVLMLLGICATAQEMTVDEILKGYLENTGGEEKWESLQGIKMLAKINQGGFEIPLEIVQLASGKQYTKVTVQGNEYYQNAFDGETLWGHNFQSNKAEKSDQESTDNFKLESNDFPEAFINYKEKGYEAELEGTEMMDGVETYKIKLVKEPHTIDGKKVDDVVFYFFDKEGLVPLAIEISVKSGPESGKIRKVTMSDYTEVEGLYFPFAITQGLKDNAASQQPIIFDSITLNPKIEDSIFAFPDE